MAARAAKDSRVLTAVTDGIVAAVGELRDGFYSKGGAGCGFVVYPKKRLFARGEDILVCAPIDGAVTDILPQGGVEMRTGDGVSVRVLFGSEHRLSTQVGDVLLRGSELCVLRRDSAMISGAVAVLFPEPNEITELHVADGRKLCGDAAAFFKAAAVSP